MAETPAGPRPCSNRLVQCRLQRVPFRRVVGCLPSGILQGTASAGARGAKAPPARGRAQSAPSMNSMEHEAGRNTPAVASTLLRTAAGTTQLVRQQCFAASV